MCENLHAIPPADGFDGVAVPGDRGHAKAEALKERGAIDIDDKLVKDLQAAL
jgi:LDH2 family malate/lactate/ureidoglycolate dehydrogenase